MSRISFVCTYFRIIVVPKKGTIPKVPGDNVRGRSNVRKLFQTFTCKCVFLIFWHWAINVVFWQNLSHGKAICLSSGVWEQENRGIDLTKDSNPGNRVRWGEKIIEPPHDKTNKVACAPSEDSDQPGHPPILIRVFTIRMKKPWVLSYPLSAQRSLIRLGGCPGWSESSLGAQVILWVLSRGGSYKKNIIRAWWLVEQCDLFRGNKGTRWYGLHSSVNERLAQTGR